MQGLILLTFLLSGNCLSAPVTSPTHTSNPPVATVTALPDKTFLKLGEAISVTVVLRAGPRGAYVAKSSIRTCKVDEFWCGRHIGNVSGFDISVRTLTGKNALPMGHGGVADFGVPLSPLSPEEIFEKYFEFLHPREQVIWHGSAGSTPTKPGKYEVIGYYIPDGPELALAELPEANGLLIAKTIESTPAVITIVK
jgi:hypothetical protein